LFCIAYAPIASPLGRFHRGTRDISLGGWLGIDAAQRGGEEIELLLPVFAVAVDPDGSGEDRFREQAAPVDAAAAFLSDKPGAHQHLDVPGHGLQRDVERLSQFRHERWSCLEPLQDRAAYRVGERKEGAIEDFFLRVALVAAVEVVDVVCGSGHVCGSRHARPISTYMLIVNARVYLLRPPFRHPQAARFSSIDVNAALTTSHNELFNAAA